MLWNDLRQYTEEPFDDEDELEAAIAETSDQLFGSERVYLDLKRKIGAKGGVRNIPDGYLIDLSSAKEPLLYVVEVELAKHEPLRHIAVQILEFSLSFETTPHKLKKYLRAAIVKDPRAAATCEAYLKRAGLENLDVLLERMIYGGSGFRALMIIDELDEELETVLISRFKFPVEIMTLERFCSDNRERIYRFEPFFSEVSGAATGMAKLPSLDRTDIDTIVVPAREDGFNRVFLGEHRWWSIRIHPSMIPRIKYIAAYQVAPLSAVTHLAEVESIEQWKDTNKYVVNFVSPARKIGPIALVPNSTVRAPQAPRYTAHDRLMKAQNLDEAF